MTFVNNQFKVQFGAWTTGHFSLTNLYSEHMQFRNRWSASNCGFDLARYLGTMFYLEQHAELDYIVFIDPEYETTASFLRQATFHPIAMITHPQTVLIKSRKRAGPRRARKIWIPRPAWWDSGWTFTKEIAQKGMFIYFFMFIDLDHPWIDSHLDVEINSGADNDGVIWWKKMDWKTEWDKYVEKTVKTDDVDKVDSVKACYGPLMLRERDLQEYKNNEQVTAFYKSYWMWGGRNLTIKKVCDPTKDPQQ